MTDFFDACGPSFLGLQILRLYNEIDKGGTRALAATSSKLPSRVASLLIFLKHRGRSSISELTKALGVSHQLASQRLVVLHEKALIDKVADIEDRRRMLIELSAKGRKAADEVEAVCKVGDAAYRLLFEEIGADVLACVIKARHALEDRSLDRRIRDIGTTAKIRTTIRRT